MNVLRKNSSVASTLSAWMIVGYLSSVSGCAMFSAPALSGFQNEPEYVNPQQVITVWSDTVLNRAGQRGTRGCGGRVMFYAGDSKKAVRVDGSLIVYAWDDSSDSLQRKPDKKFVFPASDFQKHYSESKVGHSYSFWVPWDGAGSEQKKLTLLTRFVSSNGTEVTSSPANVILPGNVPMPDSMLQAKSSDVKLRRTPKTTGRKSGNGIQLATHEETSDRRTGRFTDSEDDSAQRRREDDFFSNVGKTTPVHAGSNSSLRSHEINLTSGFLRRNLNNASSPGDLTADDLFGENSDAPAKNVESNRFRNAAAGDSNAYQNSLEAEPAEETDESSGAAVNSNSAGNQFPEAAVNSSSQPNRSLRFQDRVRTSRATQRSVDRALNERYQSKSRIPPWKKDEL